MSRDQTDLFLPLSMHDRLEACKRAADALSWRVIPTHATGLSCRQMAPTPMVTGNPVTAEVSLSLASDHATSVTLQGHNVGFGPFQRQHGRQRLQECGRAQLFSFLTSTRKRKDSTVRLPDLDGVVVIRPHPVPRGRPQASRLTYEGSGAVLVYGSRPERKPLEATAVWLRRTAGTQPPRHGPSVTEGSNHGLHR
jgi:hypothetical protein